MSKKEIAAMLFKEGYNCAQAVLATFSEEIGLSREQALKIASPFGGGLARTRGQCGTVSAMAMVIGLLKGNDTAEQNGDTYALTRAAIEEFTAKNGTIVCGDLLKNVKNLTSGGNPDPRTEEYYKIRPCMKFVFDAVEIIEKFCL